KPIVAWSQVFHEESETGPTSRTWLAALLARSWTLTRIRRGRRAWHGLEKSRELLARPLPPPRASRAEWIGRVVLTPLARVIALVLTALRHFAAVIIGAILMIPPGVLIGLSPTLARRAQPIVQVIASFPAPMFFPIITIAILKFLPAGSFEWACVLLTLFGTQ